MNKRNRNRNRLNAMQRRAGGYFQYEAKESASKNVDALSCREPPSEIIRDPT
jgi:hypothetical protein